MPWYVLRSKPQHEIKSAKILEKLGIEVFCPVITEIRQWSDRKKKVITPLFKPYLFVRLDAAERNKVFEAPGILNYMFWLGKPAVVREDEIETIKSWLSNDAYEEFEVGAFKPGEEIEIKTGKMANKKAIIKEVGTKRLKLILPDLGWTLSTKIQDVV
ncbi:Transcription antitermination factor NusG [Salegentibacter echinorum]|uniref:Transcription antitermination factor NusG n=1 Tax=Salegentibacter echinorum TaxID=1073325 RepID=A0A1M5HMR5_SALEC|nr:UpxY family transcription antiterminator [Salegentibacter echinorum]SHG17198.1 Transcription antitermination factor NusG [Salegentibacter echinorum]